MIAHLPATLLATLLLVTIVGGCTRPPDLVGVDNAEIPAASVTQATRHKLFITTTREASDVIGAFYSATRAPELGLASVDVSVPPTHVVGELERPENLPPDPRTEFAVIDPAVYLTDASFVAAINRELAARAPADRRLLVFVHGYNTSTSDAVLRLGQFVEDSGFAGVPVLFTWASAAKAPRYVYDLNSALIARVKLKEMADILAQTNASRVDIFAHSMGTFLTMEGLVDAALTGRLDKRGKIDKIVLASPDIDIDLFRTQIGLLPPDLRERMYLLISRDDYALKASRRIAGGVPRVGAADAELLEGYGLTLIDLSEISDSSSGSHSKFAGSPEVVQLIGAGLNRSDPSGRSGTPGIQQLLSDVPIQVFGR